VIQKIVYEAVDLAVMLGTCKGTVWRMNAAGQLPKSFKLSPKQTVWDKAEIDQWLEDKKAARFATAAPAPATPVQRGINPVSPSTRTDTKRPGRPRKEAA
jgi:predicted DNA-binding transcriptional regulator AlpA